MKQITIVLWSAILFALSLQAQNSTLRCVFEDGLQNMRLGPLLSDVGARTEYHYLPEAAPRSQWAVSTFRWTLPPSWYVQTIDGKKSFYQRKVNREVHWHPMIIAGEALWRSYTLHASFKPSSAVLQSGIVFRYLHDRRYNVFCIEDQKLRIKQVSHATSFRTLQETTLAEAPFVLQDNEWLEVTMSVHNQNITASVKNGPTLTATDTVYDHGKVGFLADAPTAFSSLTVWMDEEAYYHFQKKKKQQEEEEQRLQQKQPPMVLWKKISTEGFGTGRNLRLGDLNNDGTIDILVGQVVHHGPKDAKSELSCLTALTTDGTILWQIGKPDPWKTILTNDVAFQICDIDRDGQTEVIYTMNQELIIADGATGITKLKIPTPGIPVHPRSSLTAPSSERILGDCLFLFDGDGKGYPSTLLIKDRYSSLWVYDTQLRLRWSAQCNTGHYPFAYDIDNDGKEELFIGYTLFDDTGKQLWSLDSVLKDHADGVAIVSLNKNDPPTLLCAASDEGMLFLDVQGNILKHHYNGHIQNPAVLNLRNDMSGLEVATVNFWGNQGIIQFYDAKGNVYLEFEPTQYGSMCLPLNWTGDDEEYLLLNANVEEGGAYDGWGRRVLCFPDDGHPDMCCAVLNIVGDCRDEIIVWDPHEIWIYTQADNPKEGKLYNPTRNPLWQESNYRTNVSIPEDFLR